MGRLNRNLAREAVDVEAEDEVRDVRRGRIGGGVLKQQVHDRGPDRLANVAAAGAGRLAEFEVRLKHVCSEAVGEALENAVDVGRALEDADEAVQARARLLREALLGVEKPRLGEDGDDLDGQERDLVLLVAADEQRDLDDGVRLEKERLVDRRELGEPRALVLWNVHRRKSECLHVYVEERRLEREHAAEDAHAAQDALGKQRCARAVVGDRVVPGADDREDRAEELAVGQQAREDVEARVHDELRDRRRRRRG